MKKIIILLFVFFISTSAFGMNEINEYCSVEPYPIKSKAVGFVSNITLANFLSTKGIELAIQRQLKKDLKSSFNVEIYPFSLSDLADGKFKKITVKAKKIEAPDFAITDFWAESLCGYNRIVLNDDKIYFGENFLIGYEAKITNSDIIHTLLSPKYINIINNLNVNLAGISVFRLHDPKIEIKNGRIHFSIRAHCSNFLKDFDMGVSANTSLKIENDKIVFSDIRFGNNYAFGSDAVLKVLNLLNPFNTKIKIDDNNVLYIKTKNLNIADDVIITNGIAVIKKNWFMD